MYDWLGLRDQPVEMAVLAELLLRGPQTEGELRARASRMAPLPDLAGLVVPLTPPGRRRGVVVTHDLYPPDELERVRQSFVSAGDEDDDEPEGAPRPARAARDEELERLREELAALRATVEGLAADVAALKAELGA
jgi:uncharacterized protein YceH (UPF0502 family)